MMRLPKASALAVAALLAACLVPGARISAASDDPDSGAEILGKPAPEWSFTRWVRGPSHSIHGLRGKVVLVRWWTEGCHYCKSTLPVLEKLRREHGDDLVVLGVFHPKPRPHDVSDGHILRVARELGFSGPIAFDRDWTTLNRWWLDGDPDRSWTSVSFLVDREGVIRWVQGGGEYHPSSDPRHRTCDLEYQGLERALREALDQTAARPTGS